jgi:hypothetical protein
MAMLPRNRNKGKPGEGLTFELRARPVRAVGPPTNGWALTLDTKLFLMGRLFPHRTPRLLPPFPQAVPFQQLALH